jgi:hypothetical protein
MLDTYNVVEHTIGILKKSDALLHARSSIATANRPMYALSSIRSIYTATADRNPQLLVALVAAHHSVRSPQAASRRHPHTTPRLLPCRAPSPPRPLCLVTPCPVPRRVEVLPTPPFPTRRSWPLSTSAPLHRSTSASDIPRSGVARPRAGFSGYTLHSLSSSNVASTCCKGMLQAFQVFHMHVVSISCGCCKK